jgi:hypothetical protein
LFESPLLVFIFRPFSFDPAMVVVVPKQKSRSLKSRFESAFETAAMLRGPSLDQMATDIRLLSGVLTSFVPAGSRNEKRVKSMA